MGLGRFEPPSKGSGPNDDVMPQESRPVDDAIELAADRTREAQEDFLEVQPHDEEAGNPTGRTIDGESNSLELKQPQQTERPINSKGESSRERSSASSSDTPPTGGPLGA